MLNPRNNSDPLAAGEDIRLVVEEAIDFPATHPDPVDGRHPDRDEAISLDGVDDVLLLPDGQDVNLGVHREVTIAAWFYVNDATVASRKQVIYEQGGISRGLNLCVYYGKLYGGGWNNDGTQSGWDGSYISTPVQSDRWHHAVLVLSGDETVAADALILYLDGEVVGSAEGSQLWEHTDSTGIGAVNGGTQFHDGDVSGGEHAFGWLIDEVVIIPSAVGSDGVHTLMNSTYPAISIDDDFITFEAVALSSVVSSGAARVNEDAISGVQRFEQEVEAALDLQETIDFPVLVMIGTASITSQKSVKRLCRNHGTGMMVM